MISPKYICFIILIAFFTPARAGECERYIDGVSGYSICLPGAWKALFTDAGPRRILVRSGREGAEIAASASSFGDPEKKKWDNFSKWHAVEIGRTVMKIIETDEIEAGKGVLIRLVV